MPNALPTQEAFERLLLCLNPDRKRAGEEYELLRLKLIKYFSLRACLGAEELADETLNRLLSGTRADKLESVLANPR
jgi:hypothetical protein